MSNGINLEAEGPRVFGQTSQHYSDHCHIKVICLLILQTAENFLMQMTVLWMLL